MENKNKPAFSVAIKDNGNPLHNEAMGLTKREYFAAMAMQGIVSNQEFVKNLNGDPDLVVTAIMEISDKLLDRLTVMDK